MKTILAIFLLFSTFARADNVLTAISTAYAAAQTNPVQVSSSAIPGADNWTIRTDIVQSGTTAGFQIVATLTIGSNKFSLVHQSGIVPKLENMPALAVFKSRIVKVLQGGLANALKHGITVDGYTLAADPATISMLTAQYLVMQQSPSAPTQIRDMHGNILPLTFAQAQQVLWDYQNAVSTLFKNEMAQEQPVSIATTFDALQP